MCRPSCSRVVNSAGCEIILVLLTVHSLVDRLANQAVVFPADGAVEDVDRVLVHTPAPTVRGGTVIAALTPRLGHRQTSLQPALVLLCRHQGSDLPLLQGADTGIRVVSVGTRHLGLLAQHDDRA